MDIIGLTGSIGMGKSTTAKQFLKERVPVFDADAVTHNLYREAGSPLVQAIEKAFPGATNAEGVDRHELRKRIVEDDEAFTILASIVHPAVHLKCTEFLNDAWDREEALVVLDVPLLLEGNLYLFTNYIVVVTASSEVQKQRVMARPGMTEERFQAIMRRQWSDELKRQAADHIIDTERDDEPMRSVSSIIERSRAGKLSDLKRNEHLA